MSQGKLTPQQWHAWATHRYSLAQGLFQELLQQSIVAAIKLRNGFSNNSAEWRAADSLVNNLQMNLKDELGHWPNPEGKYSLASHDTWRQEAYRALARELFPHGLGDPRQSTLASASGKPPISDIFAGRVRQMIDKASAPKATPEDYYRLIALFAGVEAGIPAEYSQVLPGLARDFPGSFGDPAAKISLPGWVRANRDRQRMYFADHIRHDQEHHLPGIIEPLKKLAASNPHLLKIIGDEITAITAAKYRFYEALGRQMGIGSSPR